ncbi:MEDS domain-containing protein [Dactylosporangium sp. AC04546]|uniref:MEDS domain-containing protein n=1 Tax=Dactylosporangium sp. AC04546 TaxID=2862460 RepID=UPI001EDE2279|nr:MEDS domain-containing protein [Dactylosporangium sp. AC04546]WVK80232.1 MEDS domain-containing protein [Dactylosporangium sp. AC04546]
MEAWRLGDHLSLTYASDPECRDLMVAYVRHGVGAGHRVVAYLDAGSVDLARTLTAAVPDARVGQFSVLRFGTGFGGLGFGGPDMIDSLDALREEARAAGFAGVCVAGEMSWTRTAGLRDDDVLGYETSTTRFFGDAQVAALCLYDRRRFAQDLLARLGATHPAPLLRFTIGGWGAQLRLAGELDASNAAALPAILALLAVCDNVVLVDASELVFIDAAGAGTLVRFAASRPTRHTVVRCTRGVRQALQLVGADDVPSLVLRDGVVGV